MVLRRCIFVFALLYPATAGAELVTQSYTDFAKVLWQSLREVSVARGLTAQQASLVERTAAHWFHIGPCRGDVRKVKESETFGVLQYVANARPERPTEAATLEMLAILLREGLGRPSEYVCRFAVETAAPYTPDKPR